MSEEKLVKTEDDTLITVQNLPNNYVNGFNIMSGNSDLIITLLLNGRPTQVVNMSFSTAKTFAQGLNKVIQYLETTTGMDIKTSHHIEKSLFEANNNDRIL